MTAGFVHVLLTRFNVRVGYGAAAWRGADEDWLETRLALFDAFCYPSVRAQTARFRWLVFVDAETPEPFRRRLESYDGATVVYVSGRLADERIAEAVVEHVELDAPHLITTRLDNDDAIGDTYLERVQRAFRGQELEFVNLPLGYEWHAGRLYHRVSRSNTFISLVERVPRSGERPRTVHCAPHTDLRSVAPIRQVVAPPLWLVTIHGGNAANRQLGIRRLRRGVPPAFRRQGDLRLVDEGLAPAGADLARSTGRLLTAPLSRLERR
jgi:hypothetical protein